MPVNKFKCAGFLYIFMKSVTEEMLVECNRHVVASTSKSCRNRSAIILFNTYSFVKNEQRTDILASDLIRFLLGIQL